MDYKILREYLFSKSLKQIIIENREMTKKDVDFLLNPTSEYMELPTKIKNIELGGKLFIEELDKGADIGILVDTDV